jgi:hypothetical protein
MTEPTLPDNGAIRRVENATLQSYETYLRDRHRPPSRGGNGRAWHSHVIKIGEHTYSFLGLANGLTRPTPSASSGNGTPASAIATSTPTRLRHATRMAQKLNADIAAASHGASPRRAHLYLGENGGTDARH